MCWRSANEEYKRSGEKNQKHHASSGSLMLSSVARGRHLFHFIVDQSKQSRRVMRIE